jgi:tetratricopeptide (TPR) repeat protein
LDELSGHVELGMKREALRLARQAFRRQKINSAEFNGAMAAILIYGNGLKSWKPLVEQACARLSERDKRTARSQMLGFYHSLKDWKSASHFLAARSKNACDLMFAMETLLNLRELDAAKRLQRSCLRMLDQRLDSLDHGALLLALGSYHAQRAELETAMEYFGKLTVNEIFAHNAVTAIAEIEAVRGLLYVGAGLLQIDEFRKSGTDDQAIILPQNRDAMFVAAERDLKRYEKALHKIVPPDELWRFGWIAEW